MTLPRVMTEAPASGLAAPVPWISAMVLVAGGVPGPGSTGGSTGPGAAPLAVFGVMVALSVTSAELLFVSAPLLRFRLLTSVLPDGAAAAWVSKVLEVP